MILRVGKGLHSYSFFDGSWKRVTGFSEDGWLSTR